MQLFYKKNISTDDFFDLTNQENVHLTKVLRKKVGDIIFVTNGNNQLFKSKIYSMNKKISTLKVESEEIILEDNSKLSIAIAPTKNISRIEWFLEKCVEIGVNDFYFYISQNSERKNINIERLNLKVLSAMKQSLRFKLSNISSLNKFKLLLQDVSSKFDNKFISYCGENTININNVLDPLKQTIIFIGPEGGFSEEEIILAKQFGFISVSLGKHRLRTETAGVFVCSVFKSLELKEKT